MPGRIIKKIALVGDVKVGKTSLFFRFLKNAFSDDYKETIGVNIGKKDVKIHLDGAERDITLLVWDIFGSHLHGEVRRLALENVDAVIIVSDLTNESSLNSAIEFWLPSLSEIANTSSIYFALNKSDLVEETQLNRKKAAFLSSLESGSGILDEKRVFLTSAKDATGIHEIFEYIARNVALTRSSMDHYEGELELMAVGSSDSNTLETVFDRIVTDVIALFDDKSKAQDILQESYKQSTLNSEDIIPEELDEFIDIVQHKLIDEGMRASSIFRLSSEWKNLKSRAMG
ncbi:MAG: GTP-binding protein [Candidatus Thermoplasmatota archaeon]|jgi:Ras-related protein Rab-5C|nr:GTP-binding protein [Candidatus Thermoplasmatota archaeon]MCL5794351.1 GTP-binding protein [Candidatus Thermoplasmatota archaeon]